MAQVRILFSILVNSKQKLGLSVSIKQIICLTMSLRLFVLGVR